MKLLILLIIAYGGMDTYSVNESNEFNAYSFEPMSPGYRNYTSELLSPRFKRGDNANLDTYVNRMKMIARITNGIYLIQGFIDGSITSDAFISELLQLGTITPTVIKAMDLNKLRTAVWEISNTELEKNYESRIETRLLIFDEIREVTADMGDGETLQATDEYKNQIKILNDPKVLNEFYTLSLESRFLLSSMKYVVGYPDKGLTDMMKRVLASSINEIRIETSRVRNLTVAVKDFASFESFIEPEVVIGPVIKIIEAIQILTDNSITFDEFAGDTNLINKNKENIEKLAKLELLFKDSRFEINNVRSINETRQKRTTFTSLTSGFTNGPRDLYRIARDFNDPWIKSLTNDTASLMKALNSLSSIGTIASSVTGLLKISSGDELDAFNAIIEIGEAIVSYAGNSDAVVSAIEQAHACELRSPSVPTLMTAAEAVLKAVHDLKLKIDELHKVQNLANYLREKDHLLRETFSISNLSSNLWSDVQGVFRNLKKSPGVKELIDGLKNARPVPIYAHTTPTVSELVTFILRNFSDIQTFQNTVKDYVKKFRCLQQVQNYDLVPRAVTAIQNVRKITVGTVQKGIDVVENIIGATEELVKLETVIRNLKGSRGLEIDALKMFTDPATHSMIIGSATRGIIKMNQAVNKEFEFNKTLDLLDSIGDVVDEVPALDAGDKTNLLSLMKLETKFREMYVALKNWKQGIKMLDFKSLKDHAHIFTNATQVRGIDEDLRIMTNSLKNMYALIPYGPLRRLEAGLSKLDSSGLKLSDYSKYLQEAQKSLEALDLFFVKYGTALRSPAKKSSNTTNSSEKDTDNISDNTVMNAWLAALIAVIVTLFVVALVQAAIWLFWIRKRWRRSEPVKPTADMKTCGP